MPDVMSSVFVEYQPELRDKDTREFLPLGRTLRLQESKGKRFFESRLRKKALRLIVVLSSPEAPRDELARIIIGRSKRDVGYNAWTLAVDVEKKSVVVLTHFNCDDDSRKKSSKSSWSKKFKQPRRFQPQQQEQQQGPGQRELSINVETERDDVLNRIRILADGAGEVKLL